MKRLALVTLIVLGMLGLTILGGGFVGWVGETLEIAFTTERP